MKKLLRLLPVFALLLGIGASSVSAANAKRVPAVRKHQAAPGVWVEVSGSYRCLNDPTPICTQLFDENNQPIPNSADFGTFTQP